MRVVHRALVNVLFHRLATISEFLDFDAFSVRLDVQISKKSLPMRSIPRGVWEERVSIGGGVGVVSVGVVI